MRPEEEDPAASVTYTYDDFWKPDERERYTPVTDNYDSYWTDLEPTPAGPDVDGRTGTDDGDYWDATCMFESSVSFDFVLFEYV